MVADQKQSQPAAPLAHKDHAIAAMEMSLASATIWGSCSSKLLDMGSLSFDCGTLYLRG
jgi:hypothetical protein